MKKIIKYLLCGAGLFLINQTFAKASEFILEQDPNGLTYKIERDDRTVRLYFMLVKEKNTNELIYCLEPGVALSSEIYQELSEWEYAKLNLSEEQKDYITKVAYYGYGYQNRWDLNYYYAAQILIWKKIIPTHWDIYYTNYLGGDRVDLFLEEQQQIQNDIEMDNRKPSLSNETFIWNQKDILTLTDTLEVLKYYQMKPNSSVTALHNENQLKILQMTTSEGILEFEKNYLGSPLKFYLREDGQNVMKKGSLTAQKIELFLKKYELRFEIEKVDEEENPIANVTFELSAGDDIKNSAGETIYKKDEIIQKLTTNQDGKAYKNDLYDGKYCLREIEAPNEYVINPDKHCFVLNQENQKETIKLTNQKKIRKLILTKIDGDTNIPLSLVHFKIINSSGETCFDGKTDEQGQIKIDLPLGIYQVVEIETLEEYELPKEPIEITITGEETEVNITVPNRKITKVPDTYEINIPKMNLMIEEERKRK